MTQIGQLENRGKRRESAAGLRERSVGLPNQFAYQSERRVVSMKKFFLLTVCFFTLAPLGLAVDKEVVALQQNVALLQGMVREMQRTFDEKMAVMQTLIGQSSDKSGQLAGQLA